MIISAAHVSAYPKERDAHCHISCRKGKFIQNSNRQPAWRFYPQPKYQEGGQSISQPNMHDDVLSAGSCEWGGSPYMNGHFSCSANGRLVSSGATTKPSTSIAVDNPSHRCRSPLDYYDVLPCLANIVVLDDFNFAQRRHGFLLLSRQSLDRSKTKLLQRPNAISYSGSKSTAISRCQGA